VKKPRHPRESEAVLREFTPHPYQSLTPQNQIVTVNDAWVETLGYERDTVEGRQFDEFLTDESSTQFASQQNEDTTTFGEDESLEVVHADGHLLSIVMDIEDEHSSDGSLLRRHCHIRDVNSQRESNREIERFRQVLDKSNEAIFILDPTDFSFVDVNATACERLGYTRADLLALHPSEIEMQMPDLSNWAEAKENLRNRGTLTVEGTNQRKDGSTFPVEVTVALVSLEDDYIVSIARDITNRKEYERQLKEQRDNLDLLNTVLSHDIRNHLQMVVAYTDLLSEHVDAENKAHIDTILESATQAVELTNTAREIATLMLEKEVSHKPVSLAVVLEQEIENIRQAASPATITVDGELPAVNVVADEMLGAVFHNLLQNAIQHNDTAVADIDISVTINSEYVTVRFADRGPGVADQRKEKIFGQGEKGLESSGTGLGLYLVRELVEGYGGRVWVTDRAAEDTSENQSQTDGVDRDGAVFAVELVRDC